MSKDQATRDREAAEAHSLELQAVDEQWILRPFWEGIFLSGIAYARENPSDEVRELLEALKFYADLGFGRAQEALAKFEATTKCQDVKDE